MTYELAKQLKDARFPFREYHGDGNGDLMFNGDSKKYREPTLSELIDEVIKNPYHSFSLTHIEDHHINGKGTDQYVWITYLQTLADKSGLTSFIGKDIRCKTPEEALANLYLELHNK